MARKKAAKTPKKKPATKKTTPRKNAATARSGSQDAATAITIAVIATMAIVAAIVLTAVYRPWSKLPTRFWQQDRQSEDSGASSDGIVVTRRPVPEKGPEAAGASTKPAATRPASADQGAEKAPQPPGRSPQTVYNIDVGGDYVAGDKAAAATQPASGVSARDLEQSEENILDELKANRQTLTQNQHTMLENQQGLKDDHDELSQTLSQIVDVQDELARKRKKYRSWMEQRIEEIKKMPSSADQKAALKKAKAKFRAKAEEVERLKAEVAELKQKAKKRNNKRGRSNKPDTQHVTADGDSATPYERAAIPFSQLNWRRSGPYVNLLIRKRNGGYVTKEKVLASSCPSAPVPAQVRVQNANGSAVTVKNVQAVYRSLTYGNRRWQKVELQDGSTVSRRWIFPSFEAEKAYVVRNPKAPKPTVHPIAGVPDRLKKLS